MALRQLHDERFYIGTNIYLIEKHQNMVLTLLKNLQAKGEITDKIYNGLIPYKIRTAGFYLLPKIHKKLIPGEVPGEANNQRKQ